MSGQKGQNGPLALKCSQCRKKRDEHGNAKKGGLLRTGKTKKVKRRTAHEMYCCACGHTGWYTHTKAKDVPLQQTGTFPLGVEHHEHKEARVAGSQGVRRV